MTVTGAAQKSYLCQRDVTEVAGGFIRMVDAPGFLRCGDRQFATCASIQRSVVEDARKDRDAQKRFGLEMKAVADGAQQRANDREKRFAADLKDQKETLTKAMNDQGELWGKTFQTQINKIAALTAEVSTLAHDLQTQRTLRSADQEHYRDETSKLTAENIELRQQLAEAVREKAHAEQSARLCQSSVGAAKTALNEANVKMTAEMSAKADALAMVAHLTAELSNAEPALHNLVARAGAVPPVLVPPVLVPPVAVTPVVVPPDAVAPVPVAPTPAVVAPVPATVVPGAATVPDALTPWHSTSWESTSWDSTSRGPLGGKRTSRSEGWSAIKKQRWG